jgi:hypothetical protein
MVKWLASPCVALSLHTTLGPLAMDAHMIEHPEPLSVDMDYCC